MTKRSPILGYNHNVRYRGLIFHVQTEDSGVLSPHLFTHLFYTGVIISTRKLVYDGGSAEDAIKGLMQAQHKVVLKDLRRGVFDDKIDAYLGGTPGLLPRDAKESERASTEPITEPLGEPLGEPTTDPEVAIARGATEQQLDVDDAQLDAAVDRASAGGDTTRTELLPDDEAIPLADAENLTDSAPEIEIIQLDVESARPTLDVATLDRPTIDHTLLDRPTIDTSRVEQEIPIARAPTQLATPPSISPSGLPISAAHSTLPAVPPPPPTEPRLPTPAIVPSLPAERKPGTGDRAAVGASALPPARPITRPPSRPAMTPPQVVARPLPPDQRKSPETDAIEIFSQAPASIEAPPGMQKPASQPPGERPGEYAQHKKPSVKTPALKSSEKVPPTQPIPSGLARPPRTQPIPTGAAPPAGSGSGTGPIPRVVFRDESSSTRMPAPTPPAPLPSVIAQAPQPPRTFTPPRTSPGPGPAVSRTGTGQADIRGGVVMTRPAVIVGAPARPTQPRVRKAREEEGRGFGQGLISEKSLDEVILAYLSEDADEK
ncbi:MAG TPA: hypothetical protein VGM88_08550 [Kofleriaceae bacterium]